MTAKKIQRMFDQLLQMMTTQPEPLETPRLGLTIQSVLRIRTFKNQVIQQTGSLNSNTVDLDQTDGLQPRLVIPPSYC